MVQSSCRSRRRVVMAAALLACMHGMAVAAPDADDIKVRVETKGELVVVDVEFAVAAPARDAWRVLTDFDGMPKFISGLERSRVLARSGNVWRVAQQGVSSAGPLSYSYDSLREIRLKPYTEIHARALGGSMKKMDSLTRLKPEGGTTRVTYHAESIPRTALPFGIGAGFIEERMREQFSEMRREIQRRAGARRQ